MPQQFMNDPDFWNIPKGDRIKVMETLDEDFRGLPPEDKEKVLSSMTDMKVEQLMKTQQPPTPEEQNVVGMHTGMTQAQAQQTEKEALSPGQYGLAVGDVAAEAAPYVGGAAGGILGAPVGGIPGSASGAALGGMAGESYRQWWKTIRGDDDAPDNIVENMERIGKAGLEQGAYDLAGGAVATVVSKTAGPVIGKVAEKTKVLAKKLKSIKGPHLTAGEASESRFIQAIEETTSVVGAETSKAERAGTLKRYADEIVDAKADDPVGLGVALVDTVKGNKNAWKNIADQEFDELGKLTGESGFNIRVKTQPLKESLEEIQESMERLGGDLGEGLPKLVKDVNNYNPEINFNDAKLLRTKLLAQRSALEPVVGKKAPVMNAIKNLERALDKQMEEQLAQASMKRVQQLEEEMAAGLFSRKSHLEDIVYNGPQEGVGGKIVGHVYTDKATKATFQVPTKKSGDVLDGLERVRKRFGYDALATDEVGERMIQSHLGEKALHKRWRKINKHYKENSDIFNNHLVRKIIKKGDPELGGSPEVVAGLMIGKNRITDVRRLKKALSKPKVAGVPTEGGKPMTHLGRKVSVPTKEAQSTWETFQAQTLDHIIKKSTDADGVLLGSQMRKVMFDSPNALGKDFIDEVFLKDLVGRPSKKLEQIKLVIEGLEQIQTKKLGSNIGIGLRIVTYGGPAGYAIYQDPTDPKNIAIAMAPWMLSRTMLRSKAGSWMTKKVINASQSKDVYAGMARLGKMMYELSEEGR